MLPYATFDSANLQAKNLSGNNLTQIAAIANWGFDQYNANNLVGAAVAQLAIWAVEYGTGGNTLDPHISDPSEKDIFAQLVLGNFDHSDTRSVVALIPDGNSQVVVTQTAAVPEPATWAMILLGFMGVGFMAYRRNQNGPAFRMV